MHIGVPCERRQDEFRVGLTPAGVELLTAAGHTCSVEHDAGQGAGFPDHAYEKAGARIVYSSEEAYGRADLVVKVSPLLSEEIPWLREGSILMGFLHLAAGKPDVVQALLADQITAIAYETVQEDDGALPVLVPLSQVAGRMAPQVASALLRNDRGGNGILLGGVPGVPPAEVVIIGAGTLGATAASAFLGFGRERLPARPEPVAAAAARPALRLRPQARADGVARLQRAEDGRLRRRGRRRGARARVPRADRGDARHGPGDEAALADHRLLHRRGRLRRDQPADDAPDVHVRGGEHHPLLRAQHDVGRRAHGDPRLQQRRVAAHVGDCRQGPRGGAGEPAGAAPGGGHAQRPGGAPGAGVAPRRDGGVAVSWMEEYRRKTVTAEEAVRCIESGQRVFITGNCSVPEQLQDALVSRATELEHVELVQVLTFGRAPQTDPALAPHLRVNTLFISDNVRKAVNEGRADYSPCFLSEIPLLFKNGILPLDVALIHVSPPDEHGFCSFGVEVGVTRPPRSRRRR